MASSSPPEGVTREEWAAAIASSYLLFEIQGDLTGQKNLMEQFLPWVMMNQDALKANVRKVLPACQKTK